MIDVELRQKAIASTDIPAILGYDDRRDKFSVRAEKRGELTPQEPSLRMRKGKYFEQGIVQWYSDLTGHETEWLDRTLVHPLYPWIVGTPDALCKYERRGVDAKMVGWNQRHQWGTSADDIPERIQLQAHWLMLVTDYSLWDIAAWIDEDQLAVYTIERDSELERELIRRAQDFYERYIVGDELPPITGSEAASRWLREKFPRQKTDIQPATEAEILLLEEYAMVRLDEADTIQEKKRLENEIKLAIGEREGLAWPQGKFTWRRTKDSAHTNWEELAKSLLAGYADEERAALLQKHTELRPGIRRIHFDSDIEHRESA